MPLEIKINLFYPICFAVSYFTYKHYDKQTLKTYLQPDLPPVRNIIYKKNELEEITEILNPDKTKKNNYYLIAGSNGCEKSTLVNFAARNFKKGIICRRIR